MPMKERRLTSLWLKIDRTTALSTARSSMSSRDIGAAWKRILGPVYPAMALVEVSRLVEDKAKIEIEATAVIP